MPDVTLSLTAAQWQRLSPALGAQLNADKSNASGAQALQYIKRHLRDLVWQHEIKTSSDAAVAQAEADVAAEGWND